MCYLNKRETIERILFDYIHTQKSLNEICFSYRVSTATIYKYLDKFADGARRMSFRPPPQWCVS